MGRKRGKRNRDRPTEVGFGVATGGAGGSSKPSYLGLLNAIAVGEGRADRLLRAWRDATENRELAAVLNVVAIREREHAAAFTKRLCELGFGVRERSGGNFEERLQLAGSEASDAEKFASLLNIGNSTDGIDEADDRFGNLFADESIDPTTGALLGRYIAEERDSGRLLRAARAKLESPREPVLDEIAERLDRLTATLQELKSLRG